MGLKLQVASKDTFRKMTISILIFSFPITLSFASDYLILGFFIFLIQSVLSARENVQPENLPNEVTLKVLISLTFLITAGVISNIAGIPIFDKSAIFFSLLVSSILLARKTSVNARRNLRNFENWLRNLNKIEFALVLSPFLFFVFMRFITPSPLDLKFLFSGWDRYGGHSQVIAAILDERGGMDYIAPANVNDYYPRAIHMIISFCLYLAGWDDSKPSVRASLYFNVNWIYEALIATLIAYFARKIFVGQIKKLRISSAVTRIFEISLIFLTLGKFFLNDSIVWGYMTKEMGALVVLVSLYLYIQTKPGSSAESGILNQLILFFLSIHVWPIVCVVPGVLLFDLLLRYFSGGGSLFRFKLSSVCIIVVLIVATTPLLISLLSQVVKIGEEGGHDKIPNWLVFLIILFGGLQIYYEKAHAIGISFAFLILVHIYLGLNSSSGVVGGNSGYYPKAVLWIALNTLLPFVLVTLIRLNNKVKKYFGNFLLLLGLLVFTINVSDPSQILKTLSGRGNGNPSGISTFLMSDVIDYRGPIVLWTGQPHQQVASSLLQTFGVPTIFPGKVLSGDPSVLCSFLQNPPLEGEGFYLIKRDTYGHGLKPLVVTTDSDLGKSLEEKCGLLARQYNLIKIDALTP